MLYLETHSVPSQITEIFCHRLLLVLLQLADYPFSWLFWLSWAKDSFLTIEIARHAGFVGGAIVSFQFPDAEVWERGMRMGYGNETAKKPRAVACDLVY